MNNGYGGSANPIVAPSIDTPVDNCMAIMTALYDSAAVAPYYSNPTNGFGNLVSAPANGRMTGTCDKLITSAGAVGSTGLSQYWGAQSNTALLCALRPASSQGATSGDPYASATITKNGSEIAVVRAGKITADNALDLEPFKLDSSGLKREPLETGHRSLSGLLLAEFASQGDLYDAFYGDGACTLSLESYGRTISGENAECFKVSLGEVRFLGETPVVDDRDTVTVTCPFIGLDTHNEGGANTSVQIEYVTADGEA